jgi:hypothetical protein
MPLGLRGPTSGEDCAIYVEQLERLITFIEQYDAAPVVLGTRHAVLRMS